MRKALPLPPALSVWKEIMSHDPLIGVLVQTTDVPLTHVSYRLVEEPSIFAAKMPFSTP